MDDEERKNRNTAEIPPTHFVRMGTRLRWADDAPQPSMSLIVSVEAEYDTNIAGALKNVLMIAGRAVGSRRKLIKPKLINQLEGYMKHDSNIGLWLSILFLIFEEKIMQSGFLIIQSAEMMINHRCNAHMCFVVCPEPEPCRWEYNISLLLPSSSHSVNVDGKIDEIWMIWHVIRLPFIEFDAYHDVIVLVLLCCVKLCRVSFPLYMVLQRNGT